MASLGETIKVKGIALRAGTSRNNVKYTAREMQKTANELTDRPILMDHESRSDRVIGKTTFSKFLPAENAIYYEGWVKETGFGVLEAIKDGRLSTVSIGAMCDRVLEDEETKEVLAEGIHYLELSTTPTPGVVGTSLAQSLDSFNGDRFNKTMGENVKLINESATDTSKPLFSDSKPSTVPVDDKLRLRCPFENCEFVTDAITPFESHMMEIHKWDDTKADDFLRMMGVTDFSEEKDEQHDKASNNLGTDIAPKNEQPVKPFAQKGPYENLIVNKGNDVNVTDNSVKLNLQNKENVNLVTNKEEKKMTDNAIKTEAQLKAQQDEMSQAVADDSEDEEDEMEENPVAYKGDTLADKQYPNATPKPGKIARVLPYDKVSASVDKKLQSRDLIIERLSAELESLKKEVKKTPEVQEKGLVNVKEVFAAGDKAYEFANSDLRFEMSKLGKWSFWKLPKGPKGQLM
jgi:hypothetical protein